MSFKEVDEIQDKIRKELDDFHQKMDEFGDLVQTKVEEKIKPKAMTFFAGFFCGIIVGVIAMYLSKFV